MLPDLKPVLCIPSPRGSVVASEGLLACLLAPHRSMKSTKHK